MMDTEQVLFIDDDEAMCLGFAAMLQAQGYRVDTASTEEKALELAARTRYAVIIVDYNLVHENGLLLTEQLRMHQPLATYVVASGLMALDLASEAVNEYRVSFVLRKPWRDFELHSVLSRGFEEYWERVAQMKIVDAQRTRAAVA